MNHLCEGIAFVMNEYEFMEILLPKYLEKIGCDVSSVFCEDDEVIYLENSSGMARNGELQRHGSTGGGGCFPGDRR